MARYNTVLSTASISGTATVATPNQGLFTTLTGTAPYTITLPSPGMVTGQTQAYWNNTTGAVTLTTASGNIRGPGPLSSTSYVISRFSVVSVSSTGTDYVLSEIGRPSFSNIDVSSATHTATVWQLLWLNTSGTPITVTLPSQPNKGDTIRFVDVSNTFDTNNLTVARNGQPIMGVNEDLTVNTEGAAFDLIYYDATRGWRIFTI